MKISTFSIITGLFTVLSLSEPAKGATLILAVGLEKLVPSYNGPAIRIERPSDNSQQDIGFVAGGTGLDSSAVTSFLGQSQGWITTLYAQDGSGNNVLAAVNTSGTGSVTDNMPTISVVASTQIIINGFSNLTARNVKQAFGPGTDGDTRYFVIPAAVTINKSQASAFLAFRPDYSGSFIGFMSLYEIGNPNSDAFDIYSLASGFQGLTHTSGGNTSVAFPSGGASNNVVSRTQPTVLGLVTAPNATATIYLDGVPHDAGGSPPPSVACSGGYLMAGTGSGLYFGIPLFAQYNFLGFELYNGTVSAASAASISNSMLPRSVPPINIIADGDSITQGTGDIYGFDTLRYAEPMLDSPVDLTNFAVAGSPAGSALTHATSPTAPGSIVGLLYQKSYLRNIYYLATGTNDIHGLNSTGASTWSIVQQTLQVAKSLGYTTVVATVLHEYNESSSQSTEVNNFNSLARAAYSSHAAYLDSLADYDANIQLDPPNFYPAHSGDGIHPNDSGYQIMSGIAAPAFNSLIDPVIPSASTPTMPGWALGILAASLFGAAFQIRTKLSLRY